jgi:hypothetical protein
LGLIEVDFKLLARRWVTSNSASDLNQVQRGALCRDARTAGEEPCSGRAPVASAGTQSPAR